MEISSIIQRHMFYALSEMKYAKDKSQNNPGEVEIDAKTFLSIPDHRAFFGCGCGGLVGLSLNSGLKACKASALLLEPHLQSILLWLFWR
jgi:hypothetical protein